jgi:hypothetical protein
VTVLRAILLVLGVLAIVAALIVAVMGGPVPAVAWLAIIGAMLFVGIVFERDRYKPATPDHPGPGWVATDERFVDPDSGKEVTVYYQPSSGERRYVSR